MIPLPQQPACPGTPLGDTEVNSIPQPLPAPTRWSELPDGRGDLAPGKVVRWWCCPQGLGAGDRWRRAFTWQREAEVQAAPHVPGSSGGSASGSEAPQLALSLGFVVHEFLLPLRRPKVCRRGKGTFPPCNPELLPSNLERSPGHRGEPGTPPTPPHSPIDAPAVRAARTGGSTLVYAWGSASSDSLRTGQITHDGSQAVQNVHHQTYLLWLHLDFALKKKKKLKVCGNPAWSESIGAMFPTVSVSLSHLLVILPTVNTYSLLLCLLVLWFVISDLWCCCCNLLNVMMIVIV